MKDIDKLKINANLSVWVKLKDEGIEYYVKNHNSTMPFKFHISFNEYKKQANEYGYHYFQIWSFLDSFGGLGMRSCDYFDMELVFNKEDFEEIHFV